MLLIKYRCMHSGNVKMRAEEEEKNGMRESEGKKKSER